MLGGTTATTVFLVGVLLLLERTEGTLDVVLVSPLRPGEYLASKLITLTGLALVESARSLAAYGPAGPVDRAGRVPTSPRRGCWDRAVRFRSLMRFLPPVIAVSVPLTCRTSVSNLWPSPLFYALPTMPSLLLAKAAFLPVGPMQLVYACVYGSLAVGGALYWASRAMDRYVVRGELRS